MSTTPRSPRLLLVSAALLAVAGTALLAMPQDQVVPAAPVRPTRKTTENTDPAAVPTAPTQAPAVATAPATAPAGSTPSVLESALPPHGEGAAGDRAVQQSLEEAWPADLPADDERYLLTAGRALLRADATGIGRARWPTVFPDAGRAVTPPFATARFRVQAAVARRDGSPGKAVVHLVWAGTDRGGTFTDFRITDWHFTRTTSTKGAVWTPQPRT